jgi:hypothetical protein
MSDTDTTIDPITDPEPELTPEQQAQKEKIAEAIRQAREKAAKEEAERVRAVYQSRYDRWYQMAKLDGKNHEEADKEATELLEDLGLTIKEEDAVPEVQE